MKAYPLARRLWRVPLIPPDLVNVYIAGDVLIDSGGRLARGRLLRFLAAWELSAHALTHAHPDHQGCSHAVCERFGIPLICGEGDREAQETGCFEKLLPRPGFVLTQFSRLSSGPPHPVARTLSDGDEVGGLRVIETPGHTPGHLSFWEPDQRVLILGDVLFHRNPATLRKGLQEPFPFLTFDRGMSIASARRLAALGPNVICFGHGAPLMDGSEFSRFVERLPGA